MSYKKWLIATLSLMFIFAITIIAINFVIDHHAMRMSLFTTEKEIHQTIFPDGINQHTFNPEFIFRNPGKFDSFLFGSSRVAVINPETIQTGRFYNMSYSQGLPGQHLAILKSFLKRGVKIKTVVIGLDEFCFSLSSSTHQKHLLRIMHPDVSGESRAAIFGMYFYRKPNLYELTNWRDRVILGKLQNRFMMNSSGFNLGWLQKEKILQETGKPIFQYDIKKYEPVKYGRDEMNEALSAIRELIELAHKHNFSITFFVSPFYSQLYLNYAEALLEVKTNLAQLTNFYDFSGFNSITTDSINYYEESHYRYRVGDMIIKRIFGSGEIEVSKDFGFLVTRENSALHIENQRHELEQYLKTNHLQ